MRSSTALNERYRELSLAHFGDRLPETRVLLRPGWRGPLYAVYIPETVQVSAEWYAFHRDRVHPTGRSYVDLLLLHEMTHQAARVLLRQRDAGADHGAGFREAAALLPGVPVERHAPLSPGFLRSLPVAYKYVCPRCRAGWQLPYALSAAERVCQDCAAEHGAAASRVSLAARRRSR